MPELTVEERLTALEEAVAVLADSQDYQLGYSGEQVDELLGAMSTATDGNTGAEIKSVVNKYKTAAAAYTQSKIKSLTDYVNALSNAGTSDKFIGTTNRAYPLILQWDSRALEPQTISAGGSVTITFTSANIIPTSYTNDVVIMAAAETEDYNNITAAVQYRKDGRNVGFKIKIKNETEYTQSNVNVTVHYFVLAKSTGGGNINPLY